MSKKYYGIIPPISTPIDEHENVVESQLRALVDYTIDTGMHGIFVGGSNGECMGLTQAERDRAIKIVLDQAGDRVPVMAGVMDTSTRRVIDNIKRLEDMGGKAAVVTPTFYSRYSYPSETIRHFEEISKNTNVDILVYNIPSYTNNLMKADTIFELAKIDKVVGYKDSSNQMVETIKCIEHFKGTDFSILQGMVQLSGISILLGGDGMVPSIATAFPRVVLEVYNAAKARDIDKMMYWNSIMNECMKVCSMSPNGTSATKCALAQTGLFDKLVTLPYEPVKPEEEAKIAAKVREINELVASIPE